MPVTARAAPGAWTARSSAAAAGRSRKTTTPISTLLIGLSVSVLGRGIRPERAPRDRHRQQTHPAVSAIGIDDLHVTKTATAELFQGVAHTNIGRLTGVQWWRWSPPPR